MVSETTKGMGWYSAILSEIIFCARGVLDGVADMPGRSSVPSVRLVLRWLSRGFLKFCQIK